MNQSAIAILVAASIATPVLAEDWTGFYAGGQIGYLNYKDKTYPTGGVIPPGTTLYEGNGGQLGAFAGYTYDLGQFVLGGEVALNFSSLEPDLKTPAGVPSGRKVKQTTEIKFRAGYDAGDFLPYAIVGHGWQKLKDPTGATQKYDGLTYGVGIDYKMSSNLVAGAEFIWYELENNAPLSSLETDSSALNLRLSYRF